MNIQVRPATQDDAADACQVVRRSIAECCHDDHRGDANLLAGCPISAKGPLRDDCLKAMVVLRLVDDRIQVLQITADQSFDKPVALRAFLERL